MLPTHELRETHSGFAIYLRRPGFEFTPVTLRRIASFLCSGPDGAIVVFAFSYSMLDFIGVTSFPDEQLLEQALEVIRSVLGRDAAEPFREHTYELVAGTYTAVEKPAWWIGAAITVKTAT